MSVTVFGIAWFAILILAFIKNKAKIMLFMLILGMNFQSASVLILNGNGFGPQIVTSAVFIFWAFFYSKAVWERKLVIKKIDVPQRIVIVSTVLLCVLIIRSLQENQRMEDKEIIVLYVIQLIIYMICFLSMHGVSHRFRAEDVDHVIVVVITTVVAIGIIQFLVTTNILPRNVLLETFIYTEDTSSAYYWGSFYLRLFSVFMEPSYCGAFLVGAFYYLISKENMTKEYLLLSILVVCEILLTFSSTAYGAFALAGIVYVILSKDKKSLKFLIPIGILMLIFLSVTGILQDVLREVIFEKGNSGSAYTRGVWDDRAIMAFEENCLFGKGYKMVRGSHFYTSILGQVGIVGTILYAGMVLPLVVAAIWRTECNSEAFFVMGVILAQIIAVPDMDFCVFWLGMYMLQLSLGSEREKV